MPISSFKGMKSILSSMIDLTRKVELIIENELIKYGSPPSIDNIKLILKGTSRINSPNDSLSITPLIKNFIEKKKGDPQVRLATISVYETTLQKWIEYENSTRVYKLSDFSFEDLERFQIKMKNDGLMYSTVGKYIKTMKTFLNYFSSYLNIPMDLSFKKVRVEREEENNFVILSEYEVEVIRKSISYTRYEIGENKIELNDRERLIGRMFWFMCETGVNYIDMLNLTLHNFEFNTKQLQRKGSDENPKLHVSISFYRQKSTKPIRCEIPIHGHLIELMLALINPHRYSVLTIGDTKLPEKFLRKKLQEAVKIELKDSNRLLNKNFKIFPYVPNSSFNNEIKDICEKLGFDEVEELKLKKKGQTQVLKRKYEFITARTGRRTYITNCLKKGVRADLIMKTTGHLKMDTMRRYNLYTSESVYEEYEEKVFDIRN
jgi:hypothetical protein